MRPSLKILFLLGLVASLAPLWAGEKKEPQKIDPVVPINQKVKGMHLPYYAPNGVLRMQFDAEGAMRTDADNMQMDNLRLESFDEQGKSDMVVVFPHAVYNLATSVIKSQDTVTVKRPDFQITGKGLEFDTKNKVGTLFSQIRMEIYSKNSITSQPAASPSPSPSSTTPANKPQPATTPAHGK